MAAWRAMRGSDVGAANALGSAFHVTHPEGADIIPQRLALAPDWCFILEDDSGGFAGYAVAHPWGGATPPRLDMRLDALPEPADCVHLHDVVLVEAIRRQGHADRLVTRLIEGARRAGLPRITLVGVDEAVRYWTRQGFVTDPDPARVSFVATSYGPGCVAMVRILPPIAGA